MSVRKIIVVIGLVLTLLLAACGQSGDAALAGEWNLTLLNGQPPLDGTTINAVFENGEVGGRSGCNSYGGQYRASGQSLSISALAQTEMACMDPEGVMEQESVFLQAFMQADSFSITGDRLEIRDAAGDTILTFSPAP